jgi:hypothetical protein
MDSEQSGKVILNWSQMRFARQDEGTPVSQRPLVLVTARLLLKFLR